MTGSSVAPVIVWFGIGGGVGVTTAVAEAVRPGDLAVDLDLAHAALAPALGATMSSQGLAGLVDVAAGDIDELLVLSLVAEVPGSPGARVLAAPREPEVADLVAPESVGELLAASSQASRRVLVDAGSRFDALVDSACVAATLIVLVARDDRASLVRCGEVVALLRRASLRARVELDLREARHLRRVPSGRAAFALGIAPHGMPAARSSALHAVVRHLGRGRFERAVGGRA